LRVPSDFIKALALGADGIALANSAMQAIGCIGARICNSNNCPAGIATQRPELRARLNVGRAARQLNNFLRASVDLMKVMARACGHRHLQQFNRDDLATLDWSMARQSGIPFAGLDGNRS
jgi:glutamate synthase domain-containing protein 2